MISVQFNSIQIMTTENFRCEIENFLLRYRLEQLSSECNFHCECSSSACTVVTFRSVCVSFSQFRKVLDVVNELRMSGYVKASGDFISIVIMSNLVNA